MFLGTQKVLDLFSWISKRTFIDKSSRFGERGARGIMGEVWKIKTIQQNMLE
jgi:hypothetical protein